MFFLFCLELIVSNSQTQLPSSIIEFRAEEITLIYTRSGSIGWINLILQRKNLPNEHKKRFKSSSGTWMALLEIQTLKVETVYNLDHFQKGFTSGSQDNTRCS